MPNQQPSFWGYFSLAYQDVIRIARLMWPAALTIVAAGTVLQFAGQFVSGYVGTQLGQGVLGILFNTVMVWATAPYLFVLYRCAATGEVATQPEVLRNTIEVRRFGAWLILLGFVAGILSVPYLMAIPDLPPEQLTADKINAGLILILLPISIAVWIFTIRTTTLLPMLALDPDRASLSAAFAQTKGQLWFILGVELVTLAPALVAGVVLGDIAEAVAPMLKIPVGAAIATATQLLQIAVSVRLYGRFARS